MIDDGLTRIYLSGPMSGIPEYNFPAFDQAEYEIASLGLCPINPHRFSEEVFAEFHAKGIEPTRHDFMREDIKALARCDGIFMLPGWQKSWGAKWERIIAKHVFGMPVYESLDELPVDKVAI